MFKKISPNYRMSGASGGIATIATKQVDVDGVTKVESVLSDPAEVFPPLPSPDNFTLKAQLDAGVQLHEVPCNLINPSQRSLQSVAEKLNVEPEKPVDENE